jgi:FkbM family methyltransferase
MRRTAVPEMSRPRDRLISVLKGVRTVLRRAGLEVNLYSIHASPGAQLQRLLEHFGIDLVLDVGANRGQYAAELRSHGYTGRLVSFEPLASAHANLVLAARNHANWAIAPRMALGDTEGSTDIHVAGNSLSSSILEMLPAHERAAPGSGYVGSESAPLRRLDAVADPYLADARRVLLKIDTQGYEDRVLTGAAGLLDRVTAIQTELSLVPLYAGQRLFDEMRARIEALGFVLFAIFPGYVHETTGRTLQLDGFFLRRELAQDA